MWTIWAAYLQFGETARGSIEPGKFADMVVIDRDFLGCAEDDIRRIEPLATIVNGRVVWGRL
jgi:predicted amidohydrolase YtcJ